MYSWQEALSEFLCACTILSLTTRFKPYAPPFFLSDKAIVALQDPLTVYEAYTSDAMDNGYRM